MVWVDRIEAGRFEDTNRLFEPPARCDLRVTREGTAKYGADRAVKLVRPVFDPRRPTMLMLARYQPFHDSHKSLIVEAINRVGPVCLATRDAHGMDA